MADEPVTPPPPVPNSDIGVGTSPTFAEARRNMVSRIGAARQAGVTWEDIGGAIEAKRQEARQAGITDTDFHAAMGLTQGEDVTKILEQHAEAHLAANPMGAVTGTGDAFMQGLKGSSGGLISDLLAGTGKADRILPEHAPFATRLAFNAGTMAGDIPAMVLGQIGGSFVGSSIGAVAGAAAGGPEGAAAGAALGGAVGGGAGAFALPEAIKQTYVEALTKGEVTGPGDFAQRFGAVLWNTGKQAAVGALTVGAGKAAEAVTPITASALAAFGVKTGAELATLTTASAAMQGKLPTLEDAVDGAVLLGTFHGVVKTAGYVHSTTSNLLSNWAKTDQAPVDAIRQAYNDPVLRQTLTTPQPNEPPKGSAEVPTPDGAFVVPKDPSIAPEVVVEAYHGTPHQVEQFDTAKIGSGEGAQVFGHGLYFAENKSISEWYQSSVTQRHMAGFMSNFDATNPTHVAMRAMLDNGGDLDKARASLTDEALKRETSPEDSALKLKAAEIIKEEMAKGNLYKVALKIRSDETMMHDKPLSEQSDTVQQAFRELNVKAYDPTMSAGNAYAMLVKQQEGRLVSDPDFLNGPEGHIPDFVASRMVSEALLMRGVKGIKYLDAMSRSDTENPSYNYVMFHNGDIEITHKNGLPIGEAEKPKLSPEEAARLVNAQFAIETMPTFMERMKTNMWSIYRQWFRPDFPINQIQDAVEHGGTTLADANNPKFLRRAAELSGTTARYMIERGQLDFNTREVIGPSLNEIWKPFDGETGPVNLQAYLLARRTVSEALRDNETGVRVDAATNFVLANNARYEAAFKQIMDWRNSTLAYSRDAGLITPALHDELVKNGETLIPIYRQEAAGALEHATEGEQGRGHLGGQPTRATKGSDLPVLNIRANLMRDAFRRTELADNNRTNMATADAGKLVGMATKVQPEKRGKSLDAKDVEDLGKDMGGADGTADTPLIEALQNKGWTFKSDQVPILREGKVEVWRFEDPALTQFLKGMDQQSLGTLGRIIAGATRFTRGAIVLNPLFPLRIMAFDAPWQFITKPEARNTLADIYVGMRHVLGSTTEGMASYDGWLRSGGAENVFEEVNKNDYIKSVLGGAGDPAYTTGVWNRINDNTFGKLQAWGRSISQFQRVGRFVHGVEQGEGFREAAAQSTEAAFHRGGFGGPFAKNMNALHPFFAAYLNGLEQTVRAQFGIGRDIGSTPYDGVSTSYKALAVITLPVLGAWAAWKDEEWYKAVPDWQKDSGIPTPWGFIPLPPVLNFLYGALPRRMAEKFIGDNPHAMEGMLGALGASFIPPVAGAFTANIFQPVLEKIADHSFFRGRPLNSKATEGNMPAERWNSWSTETSKGLARFLSDMPLTKGLKLTPPEIDNFIQGWSGTLGTAAVRGAEQALQFAGLIKPNAPAMHWQDLPLLSSYASRYATASAQPILDFENRWRESAQVHGSLNRLMETGDVARYTQLASDNQAAAAIHHGVPPAMPGRPDNYQPFRDVMRKVKENAVQNKPELLTVVNAEKAISTMHKWANYIGALPNDEPLTPLDQRRVEEIAKHIGAQPTGKISATDKRQLLDLTYGTMQAVAEAGMKAMDRAGIK